MINLFLVYQADDTYPNTVNNATNFAYFSHIFGMLVTLAFTGIDTLAYIENEEPPRAYDDYS